MKKCFFFALLTVLLIGISPLCSAQSVDTLPQQDSITKPATFTVAEKRRLMLTPAYYTNWLGASFFNIASAEKEFDVLPIGISGLTFFYDFGDCIVGMESNEIGVIVGMSMRLFPDDGRNFLLEAIDYGYKHVANGTNINIESDSYDILSDVYGTTVKQYRKVTANGSVYLEVAISRQHAGMYEIVIFRAQ